MNSRNNLKLASFDGGGSRGISQLEIMQNIMHRLRFEKYPNEPERKMLPCEHFDMIGGSCTGGLIAIMFTKLQMSVEDVTEEFYTIFEAVYEDQNLCPSDRSARLRKCMEDLLKRKGVPIDATLVEGTTDVKCAGFVVATPRANVGHTVHFRTYPVRTEPSSVITVIDAVLATCASQPAFAPVSFGTRHKKQEYIGAVGANNPVRDVISEAEILFGGGSSVASILSLGCGHAGVISMAPNDDATTLQAVLRDVMLDCERRAQEVQEQIGHLGIYFRFSVEQGMQRSQPTPRDDLSWMVTQTEVHLADPVVNSKVEELLRSWEAGIGVITLDQLKHSGGPKAVYKTAPLLVTHYIRRIGPWNQLVSAVDNVHEGQKVIILAGMAGCGKTQLVTDLSLEYNPGRSSRFKYVLFVDGSSETSIHSDLIAHVRVAMSGSPQISFADALNFFQNPENPRWLVICDNVDDPTIDLRPLLPKCNHGVIVITTRNQLLRKLASKPHFYLQLDVMSEYEATKLITRCAGHQSSSKDDSRATEHIASKLGYLPVALTQAGCYMSDTGASCCEYLDLLSDHLAELMEKPSGDRQNQSAYAAFDLTYRRIPPAIKNLIHLLSFFHFANFPMAVISHAAKQSFRKDPFPFVERNVEFESAVELLEETFIPGGAWSKLTLPNLAGTLQNYSLASFTFVPLTQLLRMHPLMREWAFDRVPQERRPVFQEAARRIMACCTDAKHLHPYLPSHIEALMSRPVFGSHLVNDSAAFGKILQMAGRLQAAQNTWLPIYNALRGEYGADHLHVATAAFELAYSYDDATLKQMEALEREALGIRAASLGPKHLETLKVMSNLSGTLSRQARHEEAITMQEEALRGLRSQLPPDHPDIAEAVRSLARKNIRHNKLEEAEKLQYRLLEDQTARLGTTHLDTLKTARDLAVTYSKQGRYSEAEVLNVKVLDGRTAQLGKVHLDTVDAMSRLASIYNSQGKNSDAELLFTQVVESRKVQLGETHSKTLKSMLRLAKVYAEEGRHSEAESLQVKVLEGRKETYCTQSRYSEAETLQVEVLETHARRGDDKCFEFATYAHNLAFTYYATGRLNEARELVGRAERINRTRCGIEHPIYKLTADLLKLLDKTVTS